MAYIDALFSQRIIFDLFRIVCAKTFWHNEALEELDDSYDSCGTIFCSRLDADVEHGCPECLVTTLTRELVEDIENELVEYAKLKKYRVGYKFKWSVKKLQQDVAMVGTINASVNNEGYNPEWSVQTKTLIAIYRDESYKVRKYKIDHPAKDTDNNVAE